MTEHEQQVADCERRESRLTDWERGFIDSVSRQLAAGRRLTERQADTLSTIWEKATEEG